MAVNNKKLMKKIEKTGAYHGIGISCIVIGAFFPAPMAIAFLAFLLGSIFYEASQVEKHKKKITPNFGVKHLVRQSGVSMGFIDKEEAATNNVIDSICNMEDRHIAMMSIGSGMLCGVVLGAVIACIFMAFSWPIVLTAAATLITGVAVVSYWKETTKEIPKLEKNSNFTPAGKFPYAEIKGSDKEKTFPMLFKPANGKPLGGSGKLRKQVRTK